MPRVSKTSRTPALDRYAQRFLELKRELQNLEYFCKGTVLQRRMKCGQPGCPCHADSSKRHGPYWEWTYKAKANRERTAPSRGRPHLSGGLSATPQAQIAFGSIGAAIAHRSSSLGS